MSQTKEFLGRRIREIRKAKKFSQEQLAEKVDVDPRYISRIELGKCYPSLETLDKIAQSLEVQIRDLFEFEHFVSTGLPANELFDLLDKTDKQERLRIMMILQAAIRTLKLPT